MKRKGHVENCVCDKNGRDPDCTSMRLKRTPKQIELDLLLAKAQEVGRLQYLCVKKKLPWSAFYTEYGVMKLMRESYEKTKGRK